jgi:hypothetical protein
MIAGTTLLVNSIAFDRKPNEVPTKAVGPPVPLKLIAAINTAVAIANTQYSPVPPVFNLRLGLLTLIHQADAAKIIAPLAW